MSSRPCTTCGKALPEGVRFCGQCGTRLPDSVPAAPALQSASAPLAAVPTPVVAQSAPPTGGRVPAARTMVEFQAPPVPANFDDSQTVKRDRADLVSMMNAYDAERASSKMSAAAPVAEPPATTKRPTDQPLAEEEARVAAAKHEAKTAPDMARTVTNPIGAVGTGNPLGKTIAEASPFGASQAPSGQAFDKTISDVDAVARARDMVLGAIRDGNIAPPQPASIRPEPVSAPVVSLADSQPVRASARPPSDLHQTRADAFLQAQHRAQAFDGATVHDGSERSPMSQSVGSTPPPPPTPQVTVLNAPAAPAPAPGGAARTMLGVAAVDLAAINAARGIVAANQQPPQQQAPQQPLHAAGGASKTMLGVAIPGIAPLNPGQPSYPAPQAQAPQPPGHFGSQNKTMMGVAMPGIAPTRNAEHHGQPGQHGGGGYSRPPSSQVNNTMLGAAMPMIAPMPAPYVEEQLPAPHLVAQKRGVPIVFAIGLLAVLLLLGAGAMFLLYKPAPPVVAVPELDAEGRDVLKLTCEGCADGTKISVGTATSTLATHQAHLLLPQPLKVGQNPLVLKIDRPGAGRDEDAKIEVPVAFRLRADLSTLSATPPTITVRVEAQPGSDVRIADKPIALDAKGEAALAVDVGPDTMGPSDETKRIDRTIDYSITPKGGVPQKGTVRAQAGIAALHIDTPSSHAVLDQEFSWVSGQTTPLAEVSINEQKVTADAAGIFATKLEALPIGETKVHVVSRPKNFAARTLDFAITRALHLEDAARTFEAEGPLGYDAYADGTNSRNGAKVALDGEIVEARRGTAHQWLLLVETRRGCSKLGQCLVRVQDFGEGDMTRGERVRIYGRFLHTVTAAGKTIPEVAADITLRRNGS